MSLWLFTNCSCGGHVSACRRNVRTAYNGGVIQKTGGTSDKTTRYRDAQSYMKEAGMTIKGKYGYLYNPKNKKWTEVFNDDVKTRKERVLGILDGSN